MKSNSSCINNSRYIRQTVLKTHNFEKLNRTGSTHHGSPDHQMRWNGNLLILLFDNTFLPSS
jgi:hypothetical protein